MGLLDGSRKLVYEQRVKKSKVVRGKGEKGDS